MYSLNVPVPRAVETRRDELAPSLERFQTVRDPLTLVVKRFGDRPPASVDALQRRLEELLADWAPLAAHIDRIEAFESPAGGPAPVVYLAVDSPGIEALHHALVERFGTADVAIEGDAYVPHVTLARGGPLQGLDAVTGPLECPIEWTVEALELWSVRHEQPVATLSLGAR